MSRYIQLSLFAIFLSLLAACQSKTEVQPDAQPTGTQAATPAKVTARQQPLVHSTANKGRIEAVREIPVYSRIAEQIVMFAIENTGQYVRQGQVVARLSDAALREKILHCRARLEKAEFQYQAILMGQGYKRDRLDEAPDNLRRLARINSGYNEAKAELHELEHQLTYCTIVAPVSGYVFKIQNTLYGAAKPGEPLFTLVDTKRLKVSFEVLENELASYQKGTRLTVSTVTYPSEQYPATISAVSPVINENGMAHIEATLAPHPHLMPGMTAFVAIER
jgi:RND family efflux transporter MFP subunit